jgi:hypothetical protein
LAIALNRSGIAAVKCLVQLFMDVVNVNVQLLNLWVGSLQHPAGGRLGGLVRNNHNSPCLPRSQEFPTPFRTLSKLMLLKVHKRENFFGSDFEICIFS